MKKDSLLISAKLLCIYATVLFSASNSFCQVQNLETDNSGKIASAINYQTQATGAYSFASGYQSIASGDNSTAFGYKSTALGRRSFAIGESCYSADQGYSFGQGAKANISQSLAIGRFVETNASGAIALGSSISGTSMVNNTANSLMIGFNSTQPTLFVGPAATYTGYGKVGIATKTPLQPLHVNGNILLSGRNSTLLFADDPPANGNWGKWGIEYEKGGLNFWRPYEGLGMPGNYDPKAKGAFNYILFLNDEGNVGIGTNEPQAKFHVEGNAKIMQNLTIGEALRPASINIYGPSILSGTTKITQNFFVGTLQQPASMNIFGPSVLTGTLQVTSLQSSEASMIVADKYGNLSTAPLQIGDQMGSHIATQNIQMNGKFITNDSKTATNEGIFISDLGNVGIKTSSNPLNDDFVVYDPNSAAGTSTTMRLFSMGSKPAIVWTQGGTKSIGMGVVDEIGYLFENYNNVNNKVMTFRNGKVGIGEIPEDMILSGNHNLFVAGGITAEEVVVKLKTNPWSDYVFEDKYKLLPLVEVEDFIKQNKHLPEVPNQAEVQQNGIELGSMNALLLKKIEELTLYVIEQDKRIKELEEWK
ncbi:MAG: hypothetical protein ACOYMF_14170 [Bacteroidales bacterium]